jgi:transcriptional regulator with XRE-family HTH domain
MKIIEHRKRLGLSQEKLAEQLGVKQAAISVWESGACSPTVPHLKKLTELFNCTADELLFGDGAKLYGCTVDELLREDDEKGGDEG